MKEIHKSPLGNDLKDYIVAKDYVVSGKEFKIKFEPETGMMVTSPRPAPENLGAYYESNEYISHTESKRNLFEKVYRFVKAYSLKNKLKLINSLSPKGNLLDVGCATGDFLQVCEQAGWNVSGVEQSEKASSIALNKSKATLHKSLFSNKLDSQKFDVITLWHVLEHLPDLNMVLARLKSLLKPQGVLIIAVPNPNSYDAIHYGKYWAAYDVPRHLYHFTQESVKHLFATQNMSVKETLPMKFDSYYVSLLSEQYKTGRKRWLSAFFKGLESNIKAAYTGEYSSLIYIIKNN